MAQVCLCYDHQESFFTSAARLMRTGKSNLMDAICFVLGIKARDLRGAQLRVCPAGLHSACFVPVDHVRLVC
jgi:hypothetical protein